jgi:hypothetical protein
MNSALPKSNGGIPAQKFTIKAKKQGKITSSLLLRLARLRCQIPDIR